MRVFRAMICAVIAAMAATAMAEDAKPGPKFEFHGFIGGSIYAQDAVFNGYGEQIFYVVKQPNQDKIVLGGDARNTRLNFSLAGPTIFGGAVPKGVAEIDFFSGLNTASGGTGPVAVAPRLRLSYAELNWGSTIFRIGQDSDFIQGSFSPTSVGHIPQTFGYGSGVIGTRHLDVEAFHTMSAGDFKVELAAQIFGPNVGSNDPYGGAAGNTLTTAEASGVPGLSARLRLIMPKVLDVYGVGVWQKFDRNGQDNNITTTPRFLGDSQTQFAVGGGAKLTMGPLTVQGQGYAGKNMGLSGMSGTVGGQVVANTQGDVHEWGAWGQVGFNLTPEFSAWGYIGTERVTDYNDVIKTLGANARLSNLTYVAMLRYMDGGYALGLEWAHMHTRYGSRQPDAVSNPNDILDGNQLMLSGFYFF